METLLAIVHLYGLAAIFVIVLLDQAGVPIPALPVLVIAGAMSADDPVFGALGLTLAVVAATLGDLAWFAAGRRYGHRVLALLCRVSLSPDTCVRQSEIRFAERGIMTILTAKFIPGISTIAPPLAGALGFRMRSFILYDTIGAVLWAGSAMLAGYLFHDQIDQVTSALATTGQNALGVIAILLGLYILFRWRERRAAARVLDVARVTPDELADLLDGDAKPHILDVRGPSTRKIDARRIPGAFDADLDRLDEILHRLTPDRDVVVYCSCPNDVTAARAAMILRSKGVHRARPLAGGIEGWVASGRALEGA